MKLPALWRENAYTVEYQGDRDDVHSIPGIRAAVERGWDIVLHVTEASLHKKETKYWGVAFFANVNLIYFLPLYDFDRSVRSAEAIAACLPRAYIIAGDAEARPATLDVIDASDLAETDPVPMEWHAFGMPAAVPTLLYGDGGTGKSLGALQLATATVTGQPWLDHPVRKGPVIFLTAEDDRDEVHRRLWNIARHYGADRADLADLKLITKAGEDSMIALFDPDSRSVVPTPLFFMLRELVEKTRPALIALDTLADVFGVDENIRMQARQSVGLLRQLCMVSGAAVLCLAHPSVAGMNSGTGTSGSTGWSASVRSRLYLERIFEWQGKGDRRRLYEPDPDARTLSIKKLNSGRIGQFIALRWQAGVLVPTAPAFSSGTLATAEAREDASAEVDNLFLSLLAAYAEEGRNVGASPSASYAPALFAKDSRSGKVTKAAFVKAMNRLIETKQVMIESHGPPSRRTKRLAIGLAEDVPGENMPPSDGCRPP
jgi:RecA-family ATPase